MLPAWIMLWLQQYTPIEIPKQHPTQHAHWNTICNSTGLTQRALHGTSIAQYHLRHVVLKQPVIPAQQQPSLPSLRPHQSPPGSTLHAYASYLDQTSSASRASCTLPCLAHALHAYTLLLVRRRHARVLAVLQAPP
jgi:hypothetical protein